MPTLTFQGSFKNHFLYLAIFLPNKIKGKRMACELTCEQKFMRWQALALKNKEYKEDKINTYIKIFFVLQFWSPLVFKL